MTKKKRSLEEIIASLRDDPEMLEFIERLLVLVEQRRRIHQK